MHQEADQAWRERLYLQLDIDSEEDTLLTLMGSRQAQQVCRLGLIFALADYLDADVCARHGTVALERLHQLRRHVCRVVHIARRNDSFPMETLLMAFPIGFSGFTADAPIKNRGLTASAPMIFRRKSGICDSQRNPRRTW